jgi:hypothetical protein
MRSTPRARTDSLPAGHTVDAQRSSVHAARYIVHDARFRGVPLDGVDPHVWATRANGGLLSWDGSRWSSPPDASVGALRAAWASAGGDVWAVGDDATILAWHAAVARARR